MLLYISLLVTFGVASIFEFLQSEKILKIVTSRRILFFGTAAIIPFLFFVALGVFRETSVGADAKTYFFNYWLRIDDISWTKIFTDFSKDNGFYFLLKVISVVTDDWWVARAILFILSFSIYYAVIGTETPYPSVSMIIFLGIGFLGMLFGILRQVLAGAITLLAYKQSLYGAKARGILLLLLAVTFHKTSILFILAIILLKFNKNKFSMMQIIVMLGVSYVFFAAIIPFIINTYANSRYELVATSNGGFVRLLFFVMIVCVSYHLFDQTDANDDEECCFLFNISCCTLFIQMGALQWSLLTRVTNFFSVFWCLLLPKLIEKLPSEKRLLYYLIIFILFGVMYLSLLPDIGEYVIHKF